MFRPSSMTRPRRGNEYVAPNSAGNLAASPALSGVTSEKCCGKSLEISLRPSASAMFRACFASGAVRVQAIETRFGLPRT